jgi:hypothetical protein
LSHQRRQRTTERKTGQKENCNIVSVFVIVQIVQKMNSCLYTAQGVIVCPEGPAAAPKQPPTTSSKPATDAKPEQQASEGFWNQKKMEPFWQRDTLNKLASINAGKTGGRPSEGFCAMGSCGLA